MWSFTVSKTGKRKINEINCNKRNKILINFIVELIKVWSCVDAVFKLLHVEVARKATDRKKKKFLDSAPVFEHEQNGFCGILENYSRFCTRKKKGIVIKF